MPYLASNQDVNEQDIWGKALAGAGLVLGAAAIGGAISNRNLTKSMKKRNTTTGVINDLYGKSSKDLYLNRDGWDSIKARNFQMEKVKKGTSATGADIYKRGSDYATGVNRYNAGKSFTGAPQLKRTDGNAIQNAWTNFTNKDLKMFNKEMKDIYKGNNLGDKDIYSKSKLSLYNHLEEGSRGLNTNTGEINKMVNAIYDSSPSKGVRERSGPKTIKNKKGKDTVLDGKALDINITNDIWGDDFLDPRNIKDARGGMRPQRSRMKASASMT